MKVSSEEEIVIKRIARLVRATRKQLGLSQESIASKLGLIQSALSRIETGSQMLSAPQWAEFCRFTGISPDSIITGFVDLKRPTTLKQDDRDGTFRIPRRYAKNRGSKIRAMVPFLNYFEATFGEENLHKYLKAQKIDPDFFICLDNQISINFCLDMAEHFSKQGVLKSRDIPRLAAAVTAPRTHGVLHYQYEGMTDRGSMLELLIQNAHFYECNFAYSIQHRSRKEVEITVTPQEHLKETDYRNHPALGDFLCQYKKHYFSQFTAFGGNKASEIEEVECQFHGHEKCTYRIAI